MGDSQTVPTQSPCIETRASVRPSWFWKEEGKSLWSEPGQLKVQTSTRAGATVSPFSTSTVKHFKDFLNVKQTRPCVDLRFETPPDLESLPLFPCHCCRDAHCSLIRSKSYTRTKRSLPSWCGWKSLISCLQRDETEA